MKTDAYLSSFLGEDIQCIENKKSKTLGN